MLQKKKHSTIKSFKNKTTLIHPNSKSISNAYVNNYAISNLELDISNKILSTGVGNQYIFY